MYNRRNRRKIVVAFFFFIILAGIASFLVMANVDLMLTYSIEKVTGCGISYDKWQKAPVGVNEIEGLSIDIPDKKITVDVGRTYFTLDFYRLIMAREIVLDVDMKDVVIKPKTGVSLENGAKDVTASGGVLALSFDYGQSYTDVTCKLFMSDKETKITGFKANSKDLKVVGNYEMIESQNKASIDIKLSVSAKIAENIPPDIRGNVLTLEDDGWYSTVINYSGSPVFLRALLM